MGFFPTSPGDGDEIGPNTNGTYFKYVATDDKWIIISNITISDIAYNETSWNGNVDAATKNALRDKFESIPTGGDAEAIHDNVANEITAITEKTTPAANDEIIIEDSAASYVKKSVKIGNLINNYIQLYDTKSSGTQGGDFYSGAWRTRVLNTEAVDQPSACTLLSNQFTLIAGTYTIFAYAPAYYVNIHKLRLYNISDSSTEIIGGQAYANVAAAIHTNCFLSGQFTITSSKTFELQHYCATTNTANGFGLAMSSGLDERYANVQLWKVS